MALELLSRSCLPRVGGGQTKGLQDGPEEAGWAAYLGSRWWGNRTTTLRAGGPGDPWRSKTWEDRTGLGEDRKCQASPHPGQDTHLSEGWGGLCHPRAAAPSQPQGTWMSSVPRTQAGSGVVGRGEECLSLSFFRHSAIKTQHE